MAGRTLPNPPDAQFAWMLLFDMMICYSGLNRTSMDSRVSCEADCHFHCRMASCEACTRRGCPPVAVMDFTLPSGSTTTSNFTAPLMLIFRARAGYGGETFLTTIRAFAETSCPCKQGEVRAKARSNNPNTWRQCLRIAIKHESSGRPSGARDHEGNRRCHRGRPLTVPQKLQTKGPSFPANGLGFFVASVMIKLAK